MAMFIFFRLAQQRHASRELDKMCWSVWEGFCHCAYLW